jgi:hypothetical protein
VKALHHRGRRASECERHDWRARAADDVELGLECVVIEVGLAEPNVVSVRVAFDRLAYAARRA